MSQVARIDENSSCDCSKICCDRCVAEPESVPSCATTASSDQDLTAGLSSLTQQDSAYTASKEVLDKDGMRHSEGSSEQNSPACQASHQEGDQGSGGDGEEEDSARSWDSSCPQAFPWDEKSSLMVCVDGEKRIWYQARVVGLNNSQYLLSWPGELYAAPQSSWKCWFMGANL